MTEKQHALKADDDLEAYVSLFSQSRPNALTTAQRGVMHTMCNIEAAAKTGYAPVSVAALREDASIHKLLDMMETCRPGGGVDEEAFITKYLVPYQPYRDDFGNHIIRVDAPDDAEDYPLILWSCHTDTVHHHGGTQKVEVTNGVAWTSTGSCLGSDDTVGIWLALEMIDAKVPGVYVFHREEESGGGGSSWLASKAGDFIGSFDAAIALDRAGYSDVITHQAGGRCCSDAFAKSVSGLLGGTFEPCDTGVFTDTANYTDLIGECTNLSVGYFKQHGRTEHTNLGFASRLRDALIAADWSQLVLERKPGERDARDWSSLDWRYSSTSYRRPSTKHYDYAAEEDEDPDLYALNEFVSRYPWEVAKFLMANAVTVEDLEDHAWGESDER